MPEIRNFAPGEAWFNGRTFLVQAKEILEREVDPKDLWKRPKQLEVAVLLIRRGILTLFDRCPQDCDVDMRELAGHFLKDLKPLKPAFNFEIESWWYHFDIVPLHPWGKELGEDERLRVATRERYDYAIEAMNFAKELFRRVYAEEYSELFYPQQDDDEEFDWTEEQWEDFRNQGIENAGDYHDDHFWEWDETDARLGVLSKAM